MFVQGVPDRLVIFWISNELRWFLILQFPRFVGTIQFFWWIRHGKKCPSASSVDQHFPWHSGQQSLALSRVIRRFLNVFFWVPVIFNRIDGTLVYLLIYHKAVRNVCKYTSPMNFWVLTVWKTSSPKNIAEVTYSSKPTIVCKSFWPVCKNVPKKSRWNKILN